MDIDDKDFFVVRKNLNILSVLILVLAFSNATIHDLNFLGIQVDLEGSKLYIALYIMYAYFFWRFLTKMPFNSEFKTKFDNYYLSSEDGLKKYHSFEKYKTEIIEENPKLKEILDADPEARVASQDIRRFKANAYTNLTLAMSFQSSFGNENNRLLTHLFSYQIRASRIFLIRTLIRYCVKYDTFGDYVFPIIPVVLNLYFIFAKGEWQGSFWNLIG